MFHLSYFLFPLETQNWLKSVELTLTLDVLSSLINTEIINSCLLISRFRKQRKSTIFLGASGVLYTKTLYRLHHFRTYYIIIYLYMYLYDYSRCEKTRYILRPIFLQSRTHRRLKAYIWFLFILWYSS